MLFPTTPDAVHAEETTKATLAIQPTLAVTLPNTVNFEVQPTAAGAVTSGSATLSISTNNETGYSLYLSTADDDNALHSINPDTKQTITALTQEDTTTASFTNNTWGYNLSKDAATDSTTYQSVPTTQPSDPQITTEAPTTDTYNLTFAAKVDSSLPSGTYTNTVTVSVVTNPAYLPPFEGIETMQEMTSTICSNADEGETARLKDARDDKLYWVTKLKDGNCWMTQNLDFDIPASGLTSADSDINNASGVWNTSSGYPPRATEQPGTITSANTNTETYSWDLGMYVKSDPDGYSDYCGGSSIKGLADASCTDAGWTNVSSMTPMEDGNATDVISGSTYNAHYLVGNLYQWNAATAGTGGTIDNYATATDSICPKGWRLPTSRSGGKFDTLVGGLNSTTITQAPYYFNPSGYVGSGSLRYAGSNGSYWSSTAYSSTSNAYYLYFTSGYVNSSDNYRRYFGQSVRCLAR